MCYLAAEAIGGAAYVRALIMRAIARRLPSVVAGMMSLSLASPIMAAGIIGIAIVCWPRSSIGVDGARLPKELIFCGAALVLFCVEICSSRRGLSRSELAVTAFTLVTTVGIATLPETSSGVRAGVVTMASCVFFFAARRMVSDLDRFVVLAGITIAAVAVAISIYFETMHVVARLSLDGRGFGGTFLHRNHAAHFLVCALPATFYFSIGQSRILGYVSGGAAFLISSVVIMTRSRAAWLVLGLMLVAAIVLACRNRSLGDKGPRCQQYFRFWTTGCVLGVVLGGWICSRIPWEDSHPVRTTLSTILEYRKGSGLGRIYQAQHTAHMISEHWLRGVGPGNWPLIYPKYAPPSDPSLLSGINPTDDLPLSDWIGFASERGVPSLLLILGFIGDLLYWGIKAGNSRGQALSVLAIGILVLSCFDSPLLNAAPVAIVFAQLGIYSSRAVEHRNQSGRATHLVKIGLFLIFVSFLPRELAVVRSNFVIRSDVSERALQRAIVLQSDNYQARTWLAMNLMSQERCAEAMPHLKKAIELRPSSHVLQQMISVCGANGSITSPRR